MWCAWEVYNPMAFLPEVLHGMFKVYIPCSENHYDPLYTNEIRHHICISAFMENSDTFSLQINVTVINNVARLSTQMKNVETDNIFLLNSLVTLGTILMHSLSTKPCYLLQ